MIVGVIYEIKNLKNGKVYVGQTNDFARRRIQHIMDLKSGKHHNQHLQSAYNKYGEKSFSIYVVDLCYEWDELNEKEIYHIEKYNKDKTYNIREGGAYNGAPYIKKVKGILGFQGVLFKARKGNPWVSWAWQSRLQYKGHGKSLGHFPDPMSAQIFYQFARKEVYGD